MATRVLVTGASGFVGSAVVDRLVRDGFEARAAVRHRPAHGPTGVQWFDSLDLGADGDWSAALEGVEAVIHCAARVHVMHEAAADPLAEFQRVNVDGTLCLAAQAARAGVRRFVFVSSIGVNGAQTFERPFRADDAPAPHSPYAQSKLEAESGLKAEAAGSTLAPVIVRPPLVYGPDAPGNFRTLMHAIQRGIPLPFGAVHNRRSLVALDNLVDLLCRCITEPAAAGGTFLVSDGEDVSTPDLLRRCATALGRRARLLPVPVPLLRGAARLLGRESAAQGLCDSLQVDITPTREQLGWSPVTQMDEELSRCARALLRTQQARVR